MVWRVVRNESQFGGATMENGRVNINPHARAMWEAFRSVREIYTTSSSTVYRDPSQDQQQCMQLLATVSRITSMLLPLGLPQPMALTVLMRLLLDVLRAFGRTNVDEYLPGGQQFLHLLTDSYVPQLMQGQLPPPPEHNQKPLSSSISAAFKDLPPQAQEAWLVKEGLIQPGQMPPPQPQQEGEEQGQDNARITAHASLLESGLKHEDAERGRVAEMVKMEAEHRHNREMQREKLSHDALLKVAEHDHKERLGIMRPRSTSDRSRKE
jgi:hypothetical protein